MKKEEFIYTTYAPDTDITFILKDIIEKNIDGHCIYKNNIISTEVVGFYYGSEDEKSTSQFIGKLKARF